MLNPYIDKLLKYPLSEKEYKNIDKVWEFLEIFNDNYILTNSYRKKVINNIREKYTISEFYFYELILNKMFWNLRWLLVPYFMGNNQEILNEENNYMKIYANILKFPFPNELLNLEILKNYGNNNLKKILENGILNETNYYRSFINKLVIIDKIDNKIFIKPMEGSSKIFKKNFFNQLSSNILFNRQLYEKVMLTPNNINYKNIKLPKYYHEIDYPFPNLNFCTYKFGTKKDYLKRIKKMYFLQDIKIDKYWFKLLK